MVRESLRRWREENGSTPAPVLGEEVEEAPVGTGPAGGPTVRERKTGCSSTSSSEISGALCAHGAGEESRGR